MTADEIFSDVIARTIEGIMFHDQLANYFDFLALKGFQKEQEYHFMSETATHRKVNRYFIKHYNKLLPEKELSNSSIIPNSWRDYERKDVDTSTRRNAIDDAFQRWVEWETETKTIYEQSAKNLYELGCIAGSIAVDKLVKDVDNELAYASQRRLELESAGYDMPYILDLQNDLFEKYGKKMKGMKL